MRDTTRDEENALQALLMVRSPSHVRPSTGEQVSESGRASDAIQAARAQDASAQTSNGHSRRSPWVSKVIGKQDKELYLYQGVRYSFNPHTGMVDLGDPRDGLHILSEDLLSSTHIEYMMRAAFCRLHGLSPPNLPKDGRLFVRGEPLACAETFPDYLCWRSTSPSSTTRKRKPTSLFSNRTLPPVPITSSSVPRRGLAKLHDSLYFKKPDAHELLVEETNIVPIDYVEYDRQSDDEWSMNFIKHPPNQGDLRSEAAVLVKVKSPSMRPTNSTQSPCRKPSERGVPIGDLPVWEVSPAYESCKCQKSHCLKRYCSCFNRNLHCSPACVCDSCYNQLELREGEWAQAYRRIMFGKSQHQRVDSRCNCSGNTHCLKRYCECFANKVPCSIRCSCVSCKNGTKQV